MTERIASMEKEQSKITAKAFKYKEQNEALQKTIQEHIQVQEDLQAKLKSESKSNAGNRMVGQLINCYMPR
jgi:hypothetical protein